MPLGDRTGPDGFGPMTGRRMGFCAGFSIPGYMNQGGRRGMGFRRGAGFGRGFGRGYAMGPSVQPYDQEAASAPADELTSLRRQAGYLAQTLDEINGRIDNLEESMTPRDEE